MRKVFRVTDRFLFDRSLLITPGTWEAKAFATTLRELLVSDLPAGADLPTLIPVVGDGWARRVEGLQLWVFFTFGDDVLTIHALSRHAPIRTEDDNRNED